MSETVALTLPRKDYEALNGVALRNEGKTLAEVAESDPRRAFRIIGAYIRLMPDMVQKVATDDGATIADLEIDGDEATRGAAQACVDNLPDPDFESFQVTVSVNRVPTLRDFIAGERSLEERVLSFWVDPPNLAS